LVFFKKGFPGLFLDLVEFFIVQFYKHNDANVKIVERENRKEEMEVHGLYPKAY